ncbi:hypothetical protein GCM10027578_37320 [Spirosoma luteolum]
MAIISRKKIPFAISDGLRAYLHHYEREVPNTIAYQDLKRADTSFPVIDRSGRDTLWETMLYPPSELVDIHLALKTIYAYLKADGDLNVISHLAIDRVDLCTYGNTMPFRVRVVNRVNDNFDYFYVKNADASRIYGLELEDILSPNQVSYLTSGPTLIEEHIVGIPGDVFLAQRLGDADLNPIRLCKEFVKFNERCFARLLGDMHSANFVVDVTPDFEEMYYRIRAIDFDQQCYEGKKSVYLPQYFRQNNALIQLGQRYMTSESVRQYQVEERAQIAGRIRIEHARLTDLLNLMRAETLSTPAQITQLRTELNRHYHTQRFSACRTMGEVLEENLHWLINTH